MHRFISIYASWQGARMTEIFVNHRARRRGKSKYGLARTLKVVHDLMVVKFLASYATKPIHIFRGVRTSLLASRRRCIRAGVLLQGRRLEVATPLPLVTV